MRGLTFWPWYGEESWKPNPAQAKENMISKHNFGRMEKIPWLANFFPDCAWKPIFPWFPWLEKNVKFFPDWGEPCIVHMGSGPVQQPRPQTQVTLNINPDSFEPISHNASGWGGWGTQYAHTNCAQVGREHAHQAIKWVSHNGTRWHNICHLSNRFQALHRLTQLYYLLCYLCGILYATHHTTLLSSAIGTIF